MFIRKPGKYAVYLTPDIFGFKLNSKGVCNLQKIKPPSEKCENHKMFIRFIVKYFNRQAKREETGIFRAADYVRDFSAIGAAEKKNLQKLIEWFDENLPVPEFYDDPAKRSEEQHTYFWFKDDAREFLDRMNALTAILEENGIKVERLTAAETPGKLIFEDECQIAIVPLGEVFKIKG
jgi:hypothetical protein